MAELDGWEYTAKPTADGDCRKLVTLLGSGGMTWVGIRAWHHVQRCWYNGNEPEPYTVHAWRDLPSPAVGFWQRGILHVPNQEQPQ